MGGNKLNSSQSTSTAETKLQSNSSSDYQADEERLAALFYTLDSHKDGFVSVEELEQYLLKKGMAVNRREIEAIIARGDIRQDGKLDYQEFMLFMLEHERNLWKHFVDLDRDGSGQISYSELMHYCRDNEIQMPDDVLRDHIKRLDKDGNLQISWDEFREFNQFKLRYTLSFVSCYGSAYVDGIIEQLPQQQGNATSTSLVKKFFCGGAAGVVSRTLTAPLDRLKVLLQVQGQQKVLGANQHLGIRGMLGAMLREGYFTMWKGNGVNCLKIFPENAIRLTLFEYLNETKLLTNLLGLDSNIGNKFVNGAVTGLIVQTAMYPPELIKTRIMTATAESGHRNIRSGVSSIWKEGNMPGAMRTKNFYKGYVPAICGVMPFAALELGLSKTLTNKYKDSKGGKNPGFWPLFCIGAGSSFVAMACTYPARLMTCQMQAYIGPEKDRPGLIRHFKKIGKTEGFRGFYRGFFANSLKALPASAIGWGVFNKSQAIWDDYKEGSRTYS